MGSTLEDTSSTPLHHRAMLEQVIGRFIFHIFIYPYSNNVLWAQHALLIIKKRKIKN